MPEDVAISVASFVQSAKVSPFLLTSESGVVAPVTRSPSASSIGKTTVHGAPYTGYGSALLLIAVTSAISPHSSVYRHAGDAAPSLDRRLSSGSRHILICADVP